jgi:thymidylate kinase
MKYLYMGRNFDSSNVVLPTSRFIQFVRHYLKKKSETVKSNRLKSFSDGLQQPEEWWKEDERGKVFAALRLLNRLAEEWYRQFVSWSYQVRGYIVLYDRHFIFDPEPADIHSSGRSQRLTSRLHRWLLNHCYPKPDLVIFLDAPPKALYRRKGETTLEYLQACRQAFLERGRKFHNFKCIDALQPLEKVCAEVNLHISQLFASNNSSEGKTAS